MKPEPRSPTLAILLNENQYAAQRAERLLPLIYDQLSAAAQNCLRGEREGHTLQATALVHEAYLELVGPRESSLAEPRAHFYASAAQAMRRILVDHTRAKAAESRGGADARRAALDRSTFLPNPESERESAGFLILDETIERLESVDPEAAAVVRLRYFAGLSVEETTAALCVSAPTVKGA